MLLAKTSSSPTVQKTFADLADQWNRLANELDDALALSKALNELDLEPRSFLEAELDLEQGLRSPIKAHTRRTRPILEGDSHPTEDVQRRLSRNPGIFLGEHATLARKKPRSKRRKPNWSK
jgi:hypothetical protein